MLHQSAIWRRNSRVLRRCRGIVRDRDTRKDELDEPHGRDTRRNISTSHKSAIWKRIFSGPLCSVPSGRVPVSIDPPAKFRHCRRAHSIAQSPVEDRRMCLGDFALRQLQLPEAAATPASATPTSCFFVLQMAEPASFTESAAVCGGDKQARRACPHGVHRLGPRQRLPGCVSGGRPGAVPESAVIPISDEPDETMSWPEGAAIPVSDASGEPMSCSTAFVGAKNDRCVNKTALLRGVAFRVRVVRARQAMRSVGATGVVGFPGS